MPPAPADAPRDFRMVFFCPVSSAQLERVEEPLRAVVTRVGAPAAELAPLDETGALREAGWRAYFVRSMAGRSAPQALAAHLGEVTCAMATALQGDVVALYVDVGGDGARICRCAPDEEPETVAGARDAMLGQLSGWMRAPPAALAPLLQLQASPDEDDPDDQFVAQKLAEARAHFERYRGKK